MLLCSEASWSLEGKLVCHCNPQQTSWSSGVTKSRVRPSPAEIVFRCLTDTTLCMYWDYGSKQSAQGLGKSGDCLRNEGMMERSKTFVIPATGVSTLCSVTSITGLFLTGLQPPSYRCDRGLEGLHGEVIGDKAGTAIPAVQLRVRQQGWPHRCAHKLL